jgi:hypothetical protein
MSHLPQGAFWAALAAISMSAGKETWTWEDDFHGPGFVTLLFLAAAWVCFSSYLQRLPTLVKSVSLSGS